MRTLGPDLGSTPVVGTVERPFSSESGSVRQNRIHDGRNLCLEFSTPASLDHAIASNVQKQGQLCDLQPAV